MRSADSLSATSLRALDTSGEIAPPSTMMPSGAPRPASQGGKRCSSGRISTLPIGESPRMARTRRLPATSRRPARASRVRQSTSPRRPIETTKFEGMAKKPRILESTKNMSPPPAGSRGLLLPRLVARPGLLVHGIKAGELGAALDLLDDEALHPLLLSALLGDEGDEVFRDHHRAVVVADDDIAGEDGAAAATDRLLPADEGQAIDRGRRRHPRAPDRQLRGEHARLVADRAVGDQ